MISSELLCDDISQIGLREIAFELPFIFRSNEDRKPVLWNFCRIWHEMGEADFREGQSYIWFRFLCRLLSIHVGIFPFQNNEKNVFTTVLGPMRLSKSGVRTAPREDCGLQFELQLRYGSVFVNWTYKPECCGRRFLTINRRRCITINWTSFQRVKLERNFWTACLYNTITAFQLLYGCDWG